MKQFLAAVVVVCLVSSSAGEKSEMEFAIRDGLGQLRRDLSYPSLFNFLDKSGSIYVRTVQSMVSDWTMAIPDSISYMRVPLRRVGELVDVAIIPYGQYLRTLEDLTKFSQEKLTNPELQVWEQVDTVGFELQVAQDQFDQLGEKDFPIVIPSEQGITGLEENFESFHYHIMELIGAVAMNIESLRSFLQQVTKKLNLDFEHDETLKNLLHEIEEQNRKFHSLFRINENELANYVVKTSSQSYRLMHKSLFLIKRLTYKLGLSDEV